MLEVHDIHSYYGSSYVLQGVSLKVERGQVVVVLGRNGVGKTTLIRSIAGFITPRAGQVFFRGVEITRLLPYQIAQMGIRLVPQGRRIFPSLTVRENLEIAANSREAERARRKSWWTLEAIFDFFPPLKDRLRQRGGKLSGGEQQMLATGRALMGNPLLLLMDEPTEGLAPILVQELLRIIHRLKAEGLPILLVEQNLSFALKIAEYVYIMSRGKIVYESPAQVLWHDEHAKARYLGV